MRPKEFNRNSVLEKCISLFWKEGFNGTGIQKIVEITGVNRYSLYEEFGNKNGILIASLELYDERYIPWDLFSKQGPVKEIFFQFYTSFFRPSDNSKHPVGCYISTMALELKETPVMQEFFNAYLDTLTNKFIQLLHTTSSINQSKAKQVAAQLTLFYCISMGMYVIFTLPETEKYIQDNLNLITACLSK